MSKIWPVRDSLHMTDESSSSHMFGIWGESLFSRIQIGQSDDFSQLVNSCTTIRHTDCGEAGSAASRKQGDRVGRSYNMAFKKMKKMIFRFRRALEQLSQLIS